jgi:hypothetical protein
MVMVTPAASILPEAAAAVNGAPRSELTISAPELRED